MGSDLKEFYQVFFEEAAELLADMERLLLGLDVAAPQAEDLNAIFRAAHSIKGGAATFGFTDMAQLTHTLESLLDRLRKAELGLASGMIDVFLEAADVLKEQLAAHREERNTDAAPALAVGARLKALEGGTPPAMPVPHPAPAAAQAAPAQAGALQQLFHIEFSACGVAPAVLDHLLTDLAERGVLEQIDGAATADDRRVMRLLTSASEEDIWEALAFVVDPAQLKIEIAPAPAAALVAVAVAVDTAPQGRPPAAVHADEPRSASASGESSSIRVSVSKVDQLINLVGELVITQAMLAETASKADAVLYEQLLNGMSQLERNTRDLQESVMSIRMLPISFVFSRFPRVVRDLAAKLGKQVELKTVGEGTELDKGLIEKLADPLNHLVRNSLDHGIETPAERSACGKPAHGTITLRAFHQSGNVIVEVSDDGAGLNRERIFAKAQARGMPVHEGMADGEVWPLIFEAGFSTAEVVTDVSGRGVGMDVVKRNITALGGRVDISSVRGAGTRISIRLPLTLAILDGLSVAVGDELFIVPLTNIVESLQPAAADVSTISGGGRVIHVRGEYLPLVALHQVFHIRPKVAEVQRGIVVILETEGKKTAMLVDALIGQHQVVIKSLESNYRRVHGVSGATIMGDGRVALILDAVAIAHEAAAAH